MLFVQVFVLMQFDQGMEYRPTWGEGEWVDGGDRQILRTIGKCVQDRILSVDIFPFLF